MRISDKIERVVEIGGVEVFKVNEDGIIICHGGMEFDIDSKAKILQGKVLLEVYDDDFLHVLVVPLKDSLIEVDGLKYYLKYKLDSSICIWKIGGQRRFIDGKIKIACCVKNFSSRKRDLLNKTFKKRILKRFLQNKNKEKLKYD